MVTYRDHMDLPLTGWTDDTEWPDIGKGSSASILGISLHMEVQPKDEATKKALGKSSKKEICKTSYLAQSSLDQAVFFQERTWVTSCCSSGTRSQFGYF